MNKIFAIFLISIIGLRAHAVGVTIRGGGDEVGLDFQSALNTALNVAVKDDDLKKSIDWNRLKKLTVEVVVVEKDLVMEVNPGIFQNSIAINDPQMNLIQINRARWSGVSEIVIKQGIALHEILSLIGQEQSGQYPFSSKYVDKFGVSSSKFLASLGSRIPTPILDSYELSSVSVVCANNCNTTSAFPNRYQVSPDGTRILESKFIRRGIVRWRLFDLVGRQLVEFEGYEFRFWNMFFKDGSFLGSSNGLVSIYDRNGRVTATFPGTNVDSIIWDELSPDKDRLVLAFAGYWQLWDVSSSNPTLLYTGYRRLDSVTFDSNTKNFISSEDHIHSVTLRNGLGIALKDLGSVSVLGFAPSGGKSYYQDYKTRRMTVLDVDGDEVFFPDWKFDFIKQLLFPFRAGNWMAVDAKGLLSIWSESNQLLQKFSNLNISRSDLSPDGSLLVSEKGMNYDLELVNLKTAELFPLKLSAEDILKGQQLGVSKYVFNDLVVSAHNFLDCTSALYGWDRQGKLVTRFYAGSEIVQVLKYDPIKRRVLVKIGEDKLFVWNIDLAQPIFKFDIQMRQLVTVEFTGRGLMLITSNLLNKVQVERWEPLP